MSWFGRSRLAGALGILAGWADQWQPQPAEIFQTMKYVFYWYITVVFWFCIVYWYLLVLFVQFHCFSIKPIQI